MTSKLTSLVTLFELVNEPGDDNDWFDDHQTAGGR